MSTFIVVKDIDDDDLAEIKKEIKRLKKQLTTEKQFISRAANKATNLDSESLTEVVDDTTILEVTEALDRLTTPFNLFTEIVHRITHLLLIQETLEEPADQVKTKAELGHLEDEQNKYEDKVFKPARAALMKIKRQQTGGTPSHPGTHTTSERQWKPVEHIKPGMLLVPEEAGPNELEEWKRRLEAHLKGHESQNLRDINIIVGDYIHQDVKGSISFNPEEKLPIFNGKKSIVGKLEELWDRRNPLPLLRSKVFQINGYPDETFDKWHERAKKAFSKAELDKLDKDAIEGLIILMRYNGPHADEIRNKAVQSKKFKDGIIHVADIAEIAHTEEAIATFNKKDKDTSQVNKIQGKYAGKGNQGKGRKHEGPKHEFIEILRKEGKCFSCARPRHAKGQECNRKTFTCNFCNMSGHTKPACTFHYDFKTHGKPYKPHERKTEAAPQQTAQASQATGTNA